MPHFLDLDALSKTQLRSIIDEAHARKKARGTKPKGENDDDAPLKNHLLALVFEKASTRTRISFDVAMRQLGGNAIVLDAAAAHLHRGESMADTAGVLSRYVDAMMLRTDDHEQLLAMAEHATIPVINGLTAKSHPCQIVAAIMSFEEKIGAIENRKVAWIGDSNNVALSWIHASALCGFALHLACPNQSDSAKAAIAAAKALGANIETSCDPEAAADHADIITTDCWVSLNDDPKTADAKKKALTPYQITPDLMRRGKKTAVFMHCLPLWRGKEVAASVADGAQSLIFDEAENRIHAQKAILLWVFGQVGL